MTTFLSLYALAGIVVSSILLFRDKEEIADGWPALAIVHLLLIPLWPLAVPELIEGDE